MALETTPEESLSDFGKRLSHHEQEWCKRQPFLERCGYLLRPRYRPNWKPSWDSGQIAFLRAGDGMRLPARDRQIDATRVSDGKLVYIKCISSYSEEFRLVSLFSEDSRRDNEHDHVIPIFDVLQDPYDPSISLIVMPLLCYIDEPPFTDVIDIVDFITQTLEGLAYMHAMNVAHRDCAYNNIMMDASSIYREGFHPVRTHLLPDISRCAKTIPRRAARPGVKYYFIDFGISSMIRTDGPRLVRGEHGIDRQVPELSLTVPYDPFKVDIFILGNVFRKNILKTFSNVEFIRPLVDAMTALDPSAGPDAASALQQWQQEIRAKLGFCHLQWRLRRRLERRTSGLASDAIILLKLGIQWLRQRHTFH